MTAFGEGVFGRVSLDFLAGNRMVSVAFGKQRISGGKSH